MVLRAVKSLGRRGTTAHEVRGTMVMMSHEEDWMVGWWKGKWDWLLEGLASLVARGWMTVDQVNKVLPGVRTNVSEWTHRETVTSFGSG